MYIYVHACVRVCVLHNVIVGVCDVLWLLYRAYNGIGTVRTATGES